MKNYPQSILKRDSPLILCCAALFMLLILPLASSQELELISKESVFTSLKSNDAKTGTATFTLANPEQLALPENNLKINFNEVCGHVESYYLYVLESCQETIPIYEEQIICEDKILDNKSTETTKICESKSIITSYKEQETTCEKRIDYINGIKDYKIKADIIDEPCTTILPNGNIMITTGHQIDWIPSLETNTKGIITQEDWAWWNATGGSTNTIIDPTDSKNYTIHTFLTNGTFILSGDTPVNTTYLIVAGGGSGGSSVGGGGGAGGVLYGNVILTANNYTIIVGSGGENVIAENNGKNGTLSSFNGNISRGGGGGAGITLGTGLNGGSGGAGAGKGSVGTQQGGIATPQGQGNNAGYGLGSATDYGAGGGGGGAGALGGNATATNGGTGGIGINISINGTYYMYGCGGGGGTYTDIAGLKGCVQAADGTAGNTQGGGNATGYGHGGGGGGVGAGSGGRGSQGIVIIRYETNTEAPPTPPGIYPSPIVNFGAGSTNTDNYYHHSQNWINILTNTSYMATAKNTTIKIYNNTAPYTNATVSINNSNNFTGLEAGAFKINLTTNQESYSNNKFLSYYMFDENETLPTDIKDYYNMSNNTATLGTGYYGGGLVLDGVSGQTHGTGAYFNGFQQFNICFWAYPLNMSGTYNYAVGNNYVEIYRYNNAWRLTATNLSDNSISSSLPLAISWNAWNFVCGGWNGTHIYICKNGACIYEASTGYLNTGSLPLYIGNDGDNIRYYFNGTIDEVMIFNRSLSQAEIYEAYNMPPGINSAETRSINIYEHDNLTISSPTGINSRQININYTEARIKPSGTNISINNYTLMLYKEAVYNRTITARGNVSTGYFYNISNDATLTHGDYSIKIITSDTKDNNNSNTQSFTLNNTIPNNPTSLTTNTTAFYYGTSTSMTGTGSTDIDAGDTITYYYQVTNLNDSTTVQEYSTSNSYMPSLTDVGDTLMIKVKSSDGIDYSTGWVTKNMTVYLSYNGFRIMREKTNTPLDLATLDELSISIICEDDVQIINVTNTTYMPINISCAYEYIKIDATYDNTSYFRIISPSYTPYANITAYMLDLNYDVGVEIIIQIIDLTGDYQNGMMTIKRYLNSTQVDIISQPFDIESKATLYLLKDMLYTVTITNDDGEEQNIGNLIASSPGEKTLTLPAITFYPGTNLGDDLVWNYTYNAGVISLIYNDEDYNIINATFTISYENSTTLYSSTSTNNHSSTFTYAVPNTNLTYLSNFTIWHRTLGRIFEQKVYMGKTNVISTTEGGEFDNIEQWKFWIAMIVIIFVGLLFGARESKIGLVVVDIFYMMFAAWEWINFGAITWLIFGIMVVLTILNFISKSKEAAE